MESSNATIGQRQAELPIKEDEQRVLDKRVIYRLYEYRGTVPLYEMEIATSEERERAVLGNDFARAADIYSALFRGEVTPCTLNNIIDDCFH